MLGAQSPPSASPFQQHLQQQISLDLYALRTRGWISDSSYSLLLQSTGLVVSNHNSAAGGAPTRPLLNPQQQQQQNQQQNQQQQQQQQIASNSSSNSAMNSPMAAPRQHPVATNNLVNSRSAQAYSMPVASAQAAVSSSSSSSSTTTGPKRMSAPSWNMVKGPITTTSSSSIAYRGGLFKVRAVSDFESKEVGDLNFRQGDIISVMEEVDSNWYEGEMLGRRGIFPKSFVKKFA